MNDAMPTTALAPWTGNPVLSPTAISCDNLSAIYEILDENDAHVLERHAEQIALLCDATSRTLTTAIIEIGTNFPVPKRCWLEKAATVSSARGAGAKVLP